MQILQSNQAIKTGCIKNIKYIMLKLNKQKHLPFCNPVSSAQACTINNDISDIISHKLSSNIVNATDSISTMSSSSNLNETRSVALSSSTIERQAINYQFLQINHFDSQPNQLYFFLNMLHPLHGGAHGIVWHALNCANNYAYNVSTLEGTHF